MALKVLGDVPSVGRPKGQRILRVIPNLSVALLTGLIGTSTVNSDGTITVPDDHKHFHMTSAEQFFFYAGLMLCGAVAFALISRLLMNEPSDTNLNSSESRKSDQ